MSDRPEWGARPELVELPVARIAVDPKYQRDTGSARSRNLIAKIITNFRWPRFGAVLVVKIGSGKDAKWHVIDGQHRIEAAKALGIERVPAIELPHQTVAEAAADFVAINRDRVAVTPLHIHHAMLAAGDPEALAIDTVCRAAGIIVCRYPKQMKDLKPGETLAIGVIGHLVKECGEDTAQRTLKLLAEVYDNEPGTMTALFIRATSHLLRGGMQDAPLRAALRSAPQNTIAMIAARRAEVGTLFRLIAELKDRARGKGGQIRKCLSCRKDFASGGAHERICPDCKSTSTHRQGAMAG